MPFVLYLFRLNGEGSRICWCSKSYMPRSAVAAEMY